MEQKLKQRLVGALVLASLAVIFIPIILEGPEDKWTPRESDIPVPPRPKFKASIEPSGEIAPVPDRPIRSVVMDDEETVVDETVAEKPPLETGTESEAIPEKSAEPSVSEAESDIKMPETPAQGLGAWVIQVGSFNQSDNARKLRDRLRSAGYDTFIERVETPKGVVFRVRVGPFLERNRAESLRDTINKQQNLKGIVTSHS